MMLGRHCLKSWSSTQPSISLSSGEAEFYGLVKASGVGLGFQALLADLGCQLPCRVWTDSSAAMGVVGRQGLGKLRHLDTHSLWVQQAARSGRIVVKKVRGDDNPADLFTKHLASKERVDALVRLLGCDFGEGRPSAAPELRRGKADRQTLAEAMAPTAVHSCIEAFGVQDEVVQQVMDHVAEALPADDGLLPHLHSPEAIEQKFPSMRLDDADEGLGEDLGEVGDQLVERVGERIAETIISRSELVGRRRHERH